MFFFEQKNQKIFAPWAEVLAATSRGDPGG